MRLGPRSTLFLCYGNVCRSPYGERWWQSHAPEIDARSAGFFGPGRAPPDIALEVARRRGVEHSDHVSQSVTDQLLETADAVFVFDRFHLRMLWEHGGISPERVFWLGDFDPLWSGKRAIADPWGKSEEEFDATFARIERCVDQALRALGAATSAGSGTTPPTP